MAIFGGHDGYNIAVRSLFFVVVVCADNNDEIFDRLFNTTHRKIIIIICSHKSHNYTQHTRISIISIRNKPLSVKIIAKPGTKQTSKKTCR
jgi:hypothetical protein